MSLKDELNEMLIKSTCDDNFKLEIEKLEKEMKRLAKLGESQIYIAEDKKCPSVLLNNKVGFEKWLKDNKLNWNGLGNTEDNYLTCITINWR